MNYYVGVDEDGRILVTTPYSEYASEDMTEFTFPDDFDFGIQNEYRIVDGELVHEPLPDPPEVKIAQLKANLSETDYVVTKLAEMMLTGVTISDEDSERYSEIIANRQAWRDEINQLEKEVDSSGSSGQA